MMKVYKVLSPHIGDRTDPYLTGDERTLDEADATKLVELNVLEEVSGQSSAADALDTGADTAHLDEQIATLTKERDDAQAERDHLKAAMIDLTKERDDARADLAKARETQDSGKPDYVRDNLSTVDIDKPATSKDTLLVIAAYEQADVPAGDGASRAELVKAIKAKRQAKA